MSLKNIGLQVAIGVTVWLIASAIQNYLVNNRRCGCTS